MVKLRTVLICIAMLIMAGCKIKIEVPQGGRVETDTGLYACAEGETCYIDVDHTYFNERFSALSNEGYRFDSWAKKDRFFCGGQTKGCSLSTKGFSGNQNLLGILASDNEFYLSPIFERVYYQADSQEDDWKMVSFHQQKNYIVKGDSQNQIFNSIQSDLNPLSFNSATGKKPSGNASYSSYHRWTYRFDEQGCRVIRFQLEATYITTLPQLKGLEFKRELLQNEWRDWHHRLTIHEAGHQEINRKQYAKQLNALKSMRRPWDRGISSMEECASAVDRRRLEITRPFNEETKALHLEYHEMVGALIPW